MEFDDYQEKAALTDQFSKKRSDEALMIPLLGIAGETGTLLSEFKKKIRDKESYDGFKERAQEELGDVLWYLSNLATHLGLSLSEIAAKNLHKTQERWPIEPDRGETRLLSFWTLIFQRPNSYHERSTSELRRLIPRKKPECGFCLAKSP